jgi:hypothetical protein
MDNKQHIDWIKHPTIGKKPKDPWQRQVYLPNAGAPPVALVPMPNAPATAAIATGKAAGNADNDNLSNAKPPAKSVRRSVSTTKFHSEEKSHDD